MNRRIFMQMMMAGGVVTAEGLWMPGTKLISIPNGKQFYGPSIFELLGTNITYVGPEDKVASIGELYEWLKKISNNQVMDGPKSNQHTVTMRDDYRLTNPEHLNLGTLSQAAVNQPSTNQGLREMWINPTSLGDDDLVTDKIYYQEDTTPRKRRIRSEVKRDDEAYA